MKYAFRKQSGIRVLGFNLAEDGIYIFLWLVEFALLWRVAAQHKVERTDTLAAPLCEHGYNGCCPHCGATQTPPLT